MVTSTPSRANASTRTSSIPSEPFSAVERSSYSATSPGAPLMATSVYTASPGIAGAPSPSGSTLSPRNSRSLMESTGTSTARSASVNRSYWICTPSPEPTSSTGRYSVNIGSSGASSSSNPCSSAICCARSSKSGTKRSPAGIAMALNTKAAITTSTMPTSAATRAPFQPTSLPMRTNSTTTASSPAASASSHTAVGRYWIWTICATNRLAAMTTPSRRHHSHVRGPPALATDQPSATAPARMTSATTANRADMASPPPKE